MMYVLMYLAASQIWNEAVCTGLCEFDQGGVQSGASGICVGSLTYGSGREARAVPVLYTNSHV